MKLQNKIKNKDCKVAVIGLGYVGLPLSCAFLEQGFSVLGVDLNKEKVASLQKGISPIPDVESSLIEKFISTRQFEVTDDYSKLASVDAVSICVPTPLRKTREPDLSFIVSAVENIARYLKEEELIVLESTTYPGTTEELVLPILEKTGRKVGQDFYLAFSPERIDPGNQNYGLRNTPKVIGGITPQCLELASLLYSSITNEIVPVSSPKAAEMVKLLENTFRAVNIALVNEICLMAKKLDLNVWEVIEAAGTKPFGFMKFYPGPGLGGHFIPIDPQYLSWKLKSLNYHTRFIQLAEDINSSMPHVVVERVQDALNSHSKSIRGSKILLVGVSYKRDTSDTRESPALEVWSYLEKKGASIAYVDPYVPELSFEEGMRKSVDMKNPFISTYDCVVILTDHTELNYHDLVDKARLVVDTRNVTLHIKKTDKIFRL